jgi:hypothetical protein
MPTTILVNDSARADGRRRATGHFRSAAEFRPEPDASAVDRPESEMPVEAGRPGVPGYHPRVHAGHAMGTQRGALGLGRRTNAKAGSGGRDVSMPRPGGPRAARLRANRERWVGGRDVGSPACRMTGPIAIAGILPGLRALAGRTRADRNRLSHALAGGAARRSR